MKYLYKGGYIGGTTQILPVNHVHFTYDFYCVANNIYNQNDFFL